MYAEARRAARIAKGPSTLLGRPQQERRVLVRLGDAVARGPVLGVLDREDLDGDDDGAAVQDPWRFWSL